MEFYYNQPTGKAKLQLHSKVDIPKGELAYMNDDLIEFMHSDDGKIAMENTGNLFSQAVNRRSTSASAA